MAALGLVRKGPAEPTGGIDDLLDGARRMTITSEQRDTLIRELRRGSDLEAAAASACLELAAVRSDPDLLAKCAEAYRVATSKLKTALLDQALKSRDTHIIERQIAAREQAERGQFRPLPPKSQDAAPDWSAIPMDALLIIRAALACDIPEVLRLLAERDIGMRAAGRHELAQELEQEQQLPKRFDRLDVLDAEMPVPKSRAVVAVHHRS